MRSQLTRLVVLTLLVLTALTVTGSASGASAASRDRVLVGPALDWSSDGAAAYAHRLGSTPSLYAQAVHYPLTTRDVGYLDGFVQQASSQGAVAVLTVEPQVALADLTAADARTLASHLAALHHDDGTRFLVRFAPEMNGSWTTWGQQPRDYVHAFRTVATALHARVDAAARTVWEPAYGAGYPYGGARGYVRTAGPRAPGQMDTNGDGRVDARDDPYQPYWPGDRYVDEVGLSLYWYGPQGHFGTNAVPPSGTVAAQLAGRYGYATTGGPNRDFVGQYSTGPGKPLLLETGALSVPGRSGATELAIKRAWESQVFAPSLQQRYPTLSAVVWLEQRRTEDEAGGAVVDWRATRTAALTRTFRSELAAGDVRLGPVTRVTELDAANAASRQANGVDDSNGYQMGWIVGCVVFLAVLFLLSGLVLRYVPQWRYPDDGSTRDRRLDVFRGWIIVAVVVMHIEVAGPWSYVTLNAIGAITGAEMFVLLSGVVLGMVYPVALDRLGTAPAVKAMLRRAGRLYLVALSVVLIVFVLSYIPHLHTDVITTFTDRGTGGGGLAARGRVYDLYPTAARLLDYPPPGYAVRYLLFLRIGPWPFNIMGLFVLLTLLVPACVWLIRRRLWWLLLAISWALYVLERLHHVTLLGSQYEAVFPPLAWQIAFTHGLVLGYYRRQVTAALTRRLGLVLVVVLIVAYAAFLGGLWLCHHTGVAPPLVPADLYERLYESMYQRTFLQPGRLIDLPLMLVVAYAFLTAFWKPVSALFGWFYEPLGRVSLYVFVVHVFFVLAVANIPHLDRMSWWQGLLVHTAVLAVIWTMVRTRFLARVIPA